MPTINKGKYPRPAAASGTTRSNKYGAKPTGGYASFKEYSRAMELRKMQRAGLISDLSEQVKYELIPPQYRDGKLIERACSYIADFVYFDRETNNLVVEDTKGVRTKEYIIKRKLMLKVYGIRIKEI